MRFDRPFARLVCVALVLLVLLSGYHYRQRDRLRTSREAADAALARRDFRTASIHLDECLAIRPDDPDLHLLAARTARRRADFSTALEELKHLERLGGEETRRRFERRLLELQLNADPAIARHQMEVATTAPWNEETPAVLEVVIPLGLRELQAASLAGLSMVEGPASELRKTIESAILRWLEHAATAEDRAIGCLWRGRVRGFVHPRDGMADYRRALELHPELTEARAFLAEALSESDLTEAARELEICRRDPEVSESAVLLLAHVRRGLGQFDEARSLLNELLERKADSVEALVERGQLELDASRPGEGIAFLLRAARTSPNDASIHLALSRAYHLSGHESESEHYQQQYRDLEQKRLETERLRGEQDRDAWRKRVETERLQKGRNP